MPYGLLSSLGSQVRHGIARHITWSIIRPCIARALSSGHHISPEETSFIERSRQVGRQRTEYVDYITNVLHQHGRSDLAYADEHKQNLSIDSARKSTAYPKPLCPQISPHHVPKLGFRRILATYLEHHLARGTWSGDLDPSFELAQRDQEYLASHGLSVGDVKAWANFIVTPRAEDALQKLLHHEKTTGAAPFPLPMLLYFARRRHIPAAQLCRYLELVRDALLRTAGSTVRQATAMTIFVRLVRHARMVSPELLCQVTDLLLENMQSTVELSTRILQERTLMLNRAMALLSKPTSIRPFKASHLQQDAVARILHFMTEHTPALHISRIGYRAVAQIQLRLPKTEEERQWASLKALSWPPWKQDRTAMDSEVGPEHGVSKAGQSLQRMAEAGYAPKRLDRIAKIYAGWNNDGTPSIQTRYSFSRNVKRADKDSAEWAARIRTTRTIQEAWACWLTYEAESSGWQDHTHVRLAILKKLRQNEAQSTAPRSDHHTLPGDGIELSPLPASIHLHTYNRTEPPSTYDFFKTLQEKHVRLHLPLAAYLVANASGLQQAYEYLQYLEQWHPGASRLFWTNSVADLNYLHPSLVASIAEVLCRWSHVPLQSIVGEANVVQPVESGLAKNVFHDHSINDKHALNRAMWLLSHAKSGRSIHWRQVFHSLGGALIRHSHLTTVGGLLADKHGLYQNQSSVRRRQFTRDILAILCYRFAQKVVGVMKNNPAVPLDLNSFSMICHITQRCGTACASVLRVLEDSPRDSTFPTLYQDSGLIREAERICAERPAKWLSTLWNGIAGTSTSATASMIKLSDGMAIEPALFHVWIRAIGSFGDHAAMLQLVRMACDGNTLLADTDSLSGMRMLQRSLTALRVFLERPPISDSDAMHNGSRAQAASQAIVEEIQALVETKFRSWASDEEVAEYRRFSLRSVD